MNEIFWIFLVGGIVATFSIVIVVLMMIFIKPALDSPARFFIEGKRKKKPVCALDCGSHWSFVVGDLVENFVRDKYGNIITVTPNSLKYGRGVLFGAGEDFRSMLANASVVEIIGKAHENKIKPEELKKNIEQIEQLEFIKKDEVSKDVEKEEGK